MIISMWTCIPPYFGSYIFNLIDSLTDALDSIWWVPQSQEPVPCGLQQAHQDGPDRAGAAEEAAQGPGGVR